ncbi:MAG: S1 RNA-binding domain-containing protein [bacterium]|nr:S1 RNA-binding domain-containing protein [bacterium]
MSSNSQRRDFTPPPPPPDEGYWASLLNEGDHTETVQANGQNELYGDEENGSGSLHFERMEGESQHSDWQHIRDIMERDQSMELVVVGYNRGGLLVEWHSLRGFVPASQLLNFPATSNAQFRRRALTAQVGRHLTLRVIELNEDQNRLILSERAARAQPGERADILSRLQAGDVISGTVTNLCDFGAFIDIGGLEGLIHISELSWGRVGHPADLLKRGQLVNVCVLEVNQGAGRIALSLKRLVDDPWATVADRYRIGQLVEGTITNVVDFGAFARIEEGLEGLIHVSELAEGHFLHPRNVVSEGQVIHARILSIDGGSRRLGLSLRALT